ncbi:fluoride efflux transporter CrcB [Legionella impletisoli]|uniref:Fluoride-specific ion channel FluC n=1 Tax=Legionella impletisoli TaxID=343510 RepID=A0A917JZH1_9GAMM|nr:fluoride efflux transporter CrcB [Legionella impletisoli]GGI89675.1 putative fluoride ion transporter CrcB [Legionella impletisoli]
MLQAALAVAVGGALGALSRYGSVSLIQLALGTRYPWGTLFVNSLGSFLIGFIMSFLIERMAFGAEYWRLFLVVGFLGSYTTFSSFAWETLALYHNEQWVGALMNLFLNNLGSLFMVILGIQAERMIGGG